MINPKITEWAHDEVSQGDARPMRNKMTVVYENVFYNQGKIGKNTDSGLFAAIYYDKSASPLSISGKGTKSIFGQGGVISGIGDVFGEEGALAQGNYLQAALQSATLIKNASQISPEALSAAGYNLLGTAVGTLASGNNQSGVSTGDRLSASLSSAAGIGVYTNQYSTSNLTDVEALPAKTQSAGDTGNVNNKSSVMVAKSTQGQLAQASDTVIAVAPGAPTNSVVEVVADKIVDWLREKGILAQAVQLDVGPAIDINTGQPYKVYTKEEFNAYWKAWMKEIADEKAQRLQSLRDAVKDEKARATNAQTR